MIKVGIRSPGDKPWTRRSEVLQYRTFYGVLQQMAADLSKRGVTHVVMEASGVCTEPVYYALAERDFDEVAVISQAHARALKGHKTDARDCLRVAELFGCGLLRGSCIPAAGLKEVRDLTRYRTRTVQARTSEIQRLARALESAGIKLGSVASELTGKSATAMIEALIDGERRGRVLAGLAIGRMRTAGKLSDLSRALTGRFTDHHALLCRRQRRDAGQHRGRADPAQRLPGRHPRMACLSPAVLREVRPRVARTAAGRRQRQRHRLARRIPGHCGTRSRLAEDPGGGEARGVHRGRRRGRGTQAGRGAPQTLYRGRTPAPVAACSSSLSAAAGVRFASACPGWLNQGVLMSAVTDELLRALGDPLRARIVELLAAEQLCTCHLVQLTGARQTNISNHLRVLRETGLVESQPAGRYTFYRLRPEALTAVAGHYGALADLARGAARLRRPCA